MAAQGPGLQSPQRRPGQPLSAPPRLPASAPGSPSVTPSRPGAPPRTDPSRRQSGHPAPSQGTGQPPPPHRRQPALTQSAAEERLPRQLPLRAGAAAEVCRRVLVRCLPQLAGKISQSGTAQGGGEGIGRGMPSLPAAQRSKGAGRCVQGDPEKMGSSHRIGAPPRGQRERGKREAGRPKGNPGREGAQ